MSKHTTHQERASGTQPVKDVFQVYQRNFGKYLNEIEKAVPENFRTVSHYQISFLEAWKNAVGAVLDVQRKIAQQAQINTQVPQAGSKAIDQATQGFINGNIFQDQIVNAFLDTTEKNVKSFNEYAEAYTEFQNNLIESWFSSFKNVRN